ncbi:MAG: hypothetical protein HY226_06040 [Candidatus Vogelbacteria bacterium]|nr:hypothetical protein [Candidatus Vogelbacteria bacterium]
MISVIKKLGVSVGDGTAREARRAEMIRRFENSEVYKNQKTIDEALAKAGQKKPIVAANPESRHVFVVTTPDGKTHWAMNLTSGTNKDTYLVGEDGTVYIVPREK